MLHSIVGLMSSGKTLYMTYLLYRDYLQGRQILTNYDVNFPHIKINRTMLIQMGEKNFSLKNFSCGFDELWIYLDSRVAMENRVASYFFNQSSKDDANIYFTSQEQGQNDIRLRNNCHYLTTCTREVKINNKFYRLKTAKRNLSDYLIDGVPIDDILYIKLKHFEKKNYYIFTDYVKTGIQHLYAKPVYQLYDTTKKIRRTTLNQETVYVMPNG